MWILWFILQRWTDTRLLLARDPLLDISSGHKAALAMPGMSSFQLFPVSSLLIGSTLPLDSIADGVAAFVRLERSWVWASGEPDCACLFRLLESIVCSVREDSCYYNCVVLFLKQHSIFIFLPHLWKRAGFLLETLPLWEAPFWHPPLGVTYVYPFPKAILHPPRDMIHLAFRGLTLLQSELCLWTLSPLILHICFNGYSFGEHLEILKCTEKSEFSKQKAHREREEWPAGSGVGMQLFIAVFKRVPL